MLKFVLIFIILLIVSVAMPLPIPENNQPYQFAQRDYEIATLARLQKSTARIGQGTELLVGVGTAEITAEIGQPLMGFARARKNEGVETPCFAHALTMQCGDNTVTIVAGDLFLWLPSLTKAVIKQSGLTADDVYFTASHTHSSVGGWASGIIEEFFYGKFAQKYFDKLVDSFVFAIKQSRENLQPAKLFYQYAETNCLQNRIYPEEKPAREIIEALVFRQITPPFSRLATFAIYGAHATLTKSETTKNSADYIGAWRNFWERNAEGAAIFAAGYGGDARAKENYTAQTFGEELGKIILTATETPIEVNELVNLQLVVDTPVTRLPLGKNWRLFPHLVPYFFPPQTIITTLKIGSIILVGFPGDVASDLAPLMENFAPARNEKIILTSFNGDWRGYFTTQKTALEKPEAYEVRMSLLGFTAGEYFVNLVQKMIEKLNTGSRENASNH